MTDPDPPSIPLTTAERLAAWELDTTASEMAALSSVHRSAERYAQPAADSQAELGPEAG
jgi:hypothetical protein